MQSTQNNTRISFKSKLKFVSTHRDIMPPQQFCMPDLWTAKSTTKSPICGIPKIKTGPAGIIITPRTTLLGFDAVRFHLSPPQEEFAENSDISKIETAITRALDKGNALQGLLVGAKDCKQLEYSLRYFEKIEGIFQRMRIPFTKLKGSMDEGGQIGIAYDGNKDECTINLESFANPNLPVDQWENSPNQHLIDSIVNSTSATLLQNLRKYFKEVFICDIDLKDSGIIA